MSRAYRIRVSHSEDRIERIEDGVKIRLEVLDILPRDQMAEHLRAALVARGFDEVEGEPDVLQLAPEEGIVIRVNVQAGELEARATGEARVAASRDVERAVYDPVRGRAKAEDEVRDQLEADLAKQKDAARQDLTRRLEDALQQARPLVDQAVNEATAKALEVRAGQLGEIQSIEGDAEQGRMVIRVKL